MNIDSNKRLPNLLYFIVYPEYISEISKRFHWMCWFNKSIEKNSCYPSLLPTHRNIRFYLVSVICLIKMITRKVIANDASLNQVLPLFKSLFAKHVNLEFESCTCCKCGRWLAWNDALSIWTPEFCVWVKKNIFTNSLES